MRESDVQDLKTSIDLNLDAGEFEENLNNGDEERLYRFVSSVNIACGGHAGSKKTMTQAVRLARRANLAVGAHPSFPDREGFGRRVLNLPPAVLLQSLVEQIRLLHEVCAEEGVSLKHVKPHGALYNSAATDLELTQILMDAILSVDESLIVIGLAGSPMLEACLAAGLTVAHEGFVDRRYEGSGQLRARSNPDALLTEPSEAADQALKIARGLPVMSDSSAPVYIRADTLCIHGDTPGALQTAEAVRRALDENAIVIRPL